MGIKFSNLASTTLASGVSSSTTSISVTSATSFPTLGSGDYFYASIGIGSASEVVKVTSISGTTFTAVRGQDSTTAISHSSGAEIALRVVAATLEDLRDATDNDTTYSVQDGELSENNFTNADHSKLDGIATNANNYSHPSAHAISFITGLQTALDGKVDDSQVLTSVPSGALFTDTVYTHPSNHAISVITGLQTALDGKVDDSQVLTNVPSGALFTDTVYTLPSGYATETYVGTQISNLVDSSPATLNTLNELAAALGDDANFSTTVTNSIATKLPLAGGTLTGGLSGTTGSFSGSVTANAGVVVDNFTLDGTTLALSSGDMTLDSVGGITYRTTSTNSTAGHHIFKSYNTEIMRIDGGNNWVGIGGAPSHPLHITKEIAGYQAYFNNDNGSAQGIKVRIKSNDSGNFNMLELVSASSGSDVTAMVVRDDGQLTSTVAGGVFETRSDGGGFHYKQLLDVATAGCLITGRSNRGDMAAIALYQTATGADGGYIKFNTSNSGSTTPTEKMRIDSSGSVGIGTDSPDSGYKLDVAGNVVFGDGGGFDMNVDGSRWQFSLGGSEKMRLSGGNLLVGKTSSSFSVAGIALRGSVADFIRDGNTPINVNRLNSDGALTVYHSDGTNVGSIGTYASRLYIGNDDTFLTFEGAADKIYPATSTGAGRDNAIDLGGSGTRFKDLYLSGTANTAHVNVGGGTVADPTVTIDSASGGDPTLVFDTGATNRSAVIRFKDQGTYSGFINYHHQYDRMDFGSGSSTGIGMSLDSGNNLLVGKTTTAIGTQGIRLEGNNGKIEATRSGNIVTAFNRTGSDGTISEWMKDGSSFGAISVVGGNNLTISGTQTNHCGLSFATNAILPATQGATNTGIVDLGASSEKFKNLYLSGTISSGAISIDNGSQRVKYGVWSGTTYGVGMGTGYTYGAINNDYVMSFQMNDDSDRGFWWGDAGHANSQGAMALSTDGYLTVASGLRLGFGESDTTHPSAGLQVNGTITSTGLTVSTTYPKIQLNDTTGVDRNFSVGTNNETFTIRNETAGSDSFTIYNDNNATFSGTINSGAITSTSSMNAAGGYYVSGTEVIDASRNATFATLDLGTSNTSGKPLSIQSTNSAYGTMRIYRDSTSQGETGIGFFGKSNASTNVAWIMAEGGWGAGTDFVIGNENGGAGGNIRLQISRSGNVNVKTGSLLMGGTTVIDASRNLTNIGTISSGATTITEGVSSGTFISLKRSAGEIGRIAYSANDNVAIYGTTASHAGLNFIGGAIIPMSGGTETDNAISLGDGARNFSEIFAKGMTIGTTQVIDASRNLTNIGTINSGAITASKFIQNASSGSSFYAASFTRSGSGTTTPDIWGTGGTLVLGTSASVEAVGFSGANAQFYGTISSGEITSSGNITAFSDERLKSNVKTLDGKKVLEMRGVSFTKDGEDGSGVIAQELEKVAPELVLDGEEYKSVAYGNITGYLIEAIKEQQAEIDELKSLVKQLLEK